MDIARGDAAPRAPAGPEGAHRVFNPGAAPVRILLVSTMAFPDVAEGERPHVELVMGALNAAREHEGGGG